MHKVHTRNYQDRGNLSLACIPLFLSVLLACEPVPKDPNILLVMLDDFGYNDLALNNGSDSPTPSLDEIAREGLRFTRHYAENSCRLSRVALLTGLYPARVGAHADLGGIDREFVTLPERLGEHGYTNYMIGKWHAGDAHRESRPEYQGFNHWLGFMSQLYLKGPHEQGEYSRGRPGYQDPWLEDENGDLRQYQGHLTDILTDRAVEVVRSESKPWFLYLAYYAVHTPVEPSADYARFFPDDPAGKYQALKLQLDTNLGRLFSALRESGELANTMVIVVSDNGGTAKFWPSNLPFHGAKASYHEGALRTPLLLSWPGRWPAGEQRGEPVMIFDIYPTILAALGLEPADRLDGKDLFSPRAERELRWYSGGRGAENYSMLSRDGHWRLSTWASTVEILQNENDFLVDPPPNRLLEEPQTAGYMRDSMRRWISDTTQVTDLQRAEADSWANFSGYAFRRTPLAGAHTMGFVFKRGTGDSEAGSRQHLVKQKGYIDISEAGEELHVRVDGNETDIALPGQQQCFSLIVSSMLAKDNMIFYHPGDRSRSVVYVNGQRVIESDYQNPALSRTSPQAPLQVNISAQSRWRMPAEATPFLSTRVVTAEEIAGEIDPALQKFCAD
jgi:arylsulfatase A-like enzyme